jgi:hypothetical protein
MSGIESPVIVTMSPVSSPMQTNANMTTLQICENVASQLRLVLPDLEEVASSSNEKVNIELQQIKEPETPNTPETSEVLPKPEPVKEKEKETESKTKLIEEQEQEKKVVTIVKDFKYCYDEFDKQIKSQNVVISMDTIMCMLRIAMVIVEQSNESGKNKKEFVVRMIAKIVSDCACSSTMSIEMKVEILNMLYTPLFDDTIKLVVDASKGMIDLNKVQEVTSQVAVGCFSRCLAFMSKKK